MNKITTSSTDKQIELSFCLPVYNVAEYLEDCVRSILLLRNSGILFEIICVDDSSDAATVTVLEKLKDSCPEVCVFRNEENRGVSFTRNRALCEASGKYVWFVDPDDMINSETAMLLLECIEKTEADVVLANYEKIHQSAEFIFPNPIGKFKISKPNYYIPGWQTDQEGECRMFACWRGLFKRDFLIDNKLFFNEDVLWQEDALFYWELLQRKPLIVKCEFVCYFVRQRKGSAMRSGNTKLKEKYLSSSARLAAYEKYLEKDVFNKSELG